MSKVVSTTDQTCIGGSLVMTRERRVDVGCIEKSKGLHYDGIGF